MKSINLNLIFIFLSIYSYAQEIDSTNFSHKYYHKKSVFETLPNTDDEIVFLGNSITEQGPWRELFQNSKIINRGIGGDTTDGLLFRLSEVTASKPDKIFLMIGINDLKYGKSPNYIIDKTNQILKKIREQSPKTIVYLQSVLPVYQREERPIASIKKINLGYEELSDNESVFFIDLFSHFADSKDNDQLYPYLTRDGLHLNGNGYLLWKKLIEHYVYGNSNSNKNTLDKINGKNKNAIVVAHRGDWRHAPENSLQAIKNCIKMGVDIVEIDINMTKDSVLVIHHDHKLDRTTNLTGYLSDTNYSDLKNAKLRNGAAYVTEHNLLTLKEVLAFSKNKIVLDLDIKSNIPFQKIASIIEEYEAWDNVVFLSYRTYKEAKAYYGKYLEKMHYFPAISKDTKNISKYIQEFESTINPTVYVPKFENEDSTVLSSFDTIKANGDRIWVHTISANRSGGHHDDRAIYDIEGSYGWLLKKGVTVFQSDRPQLLLNYLKSRNLHQ